jgi:hypothetical protein
MTFWQYLHDAGWADWFKLAGLVLLAGGLLCGFAQNLPRKPQ